LATILEPAAAYVNIRAWSMPTTLLSNVIQAALLGAQDSITPLVAVAYSTVVNVIGDWYCVVPLRMGGRGAAIATVAAQIAGTLAMVRPARQKLFAPSTTNSPSTPQDRVSSRSFLAFAAPVLTLILGKISAFGIMTWVAAGLPGGVVSLAAHQITLSLFFFMSPFLEVLSQTAQAFMPQYLTLFESDGVTVSTRGKEEADKLAGRLLRYGVMVASVVAMIASSVPRFFPFMLTNDLSVQSAVRPLAAPLWIAALLTAPVAVSEGVLLARRDLKYLASIYLVSTAIFPFALSTIKKTAGPVVHVWIGFALFQLFRALCFAGRIWGPKLFGSTREKLS
jgi:Na+-driven multidrug efflux pump